MSSSGVTEHKDPFQVVSPFGMKLKPTWKCWKLQFLKSLLRLANPLDPLFKMSNFLAEINMFITYYSNSLSLDS